MILIIPGIATSSVGAASNIGTSLIEKVPLQIQRCKSACYFVFINTHSNIALFVFVTTSKTLSIISRHPSPNHLLQDDIHIALLPTKIVKHL